MVKSVISTTINIRSETGGRISSNEGEEISIEGQKLTEIRPNHWVLQ
ncbi:hypothetical protein AB4027_11560 [Alkalibacterium putridalgicola]|uniref:Uncharacterized protein n=1 Tax=Alkalibacterium putridalgicola TaxID=426703 RepID=A0ABQ0V0G2_9LACT|nr:hypothetical protein [Alkalibacterium putridalgicola]GEK90296.1 hypothetical protein APU01nite_23350 [Alkalibacterium putridalgicola]